MGQYLLATYTVAGEVPGAPHSPEDMQAFMQRVIALEAEMDEAGAFVFGGALADASAAKVAAANGEVTDGLFSDSSTQVGGFYIINAADDAKATAWGAKAAEATNHPIEVRPFRATGMVKDHMPGG